MTAVMLRVGADRCTILPTPGGGLGGWSVAGQEMLRRADGDAVAAGNPLGFASFPLVPYSNRIGHGRFEWGGAAITLKRNFPPEPHAIHGVGWMRPWIVVDQEPHIATLELHHGGDDDWPWPFEAQQHITLGEQHLTLRLIARNLADVAVPLAFGHHPYFDSAGASLCFAAEAVWMNGDNALPTTKARPAGHFDCTTPTAISGRAIDHCYDGVGGTAHIAWSGRAFALEIASSSSLPAAVVYIPAGGNAFCFEPVPNITNALNRPDMPPMPVVAPGECFEATITLRAVPAQDRGGPSASGRTSA